MDLTETGRGEIAVDEGTGEIGTEYAIAADEWQWILPP